MPNLWSLAFRWEDTWIETFKERPSLTWVAPACLVRPHTDWGSNHVSSVCIIQTKVLCKQCSSSGSNSHFAVALAKSSFFHISFDTVQAYRHTLFWLPYYNMNPHMVLDQSFYCHGPFSPLIKASDTLAGTAPMSHHLGLDPEPSRLSSVSCRVISTGLSLPLAASTAHRTICHLRQMLLAFLQTTEAYAFENDRQSFDPCSPAVQEPA